MRMFLHSEDKETCLSSELMQTKVIVTSKAANSLTCRRIEMQILQAQKQI